MGQETPVEEERTTIETEEPAAETEPGRRILERGQLITELVKGSLNYTLHTINRAFYRQFGWEDDGSDWFYVEEAFDGYVIVYHSGLPVDEYYLVTYERTGESFTFAPRDQWEVVELSYRMKSVEVRESMQTKRGKKIQEIIPSAARLAEAKANKPRRIYADLAQADVVNGNGRRYPLVVLREAVKEAQDHLNESLSQGRAYLLGESEHPRDKRQNPQLTQTIIVWKEITLNESDGWVRVAGDMIENTIGKDAIITMDAGVLPGISLRAYGESKLIDEKGQQVEEVQWMRLTGADLVLNPGFQDAAVTLLENSEAEMADNTSTQPAGGNQGGSAVPPAPVVNPLDEAQAKQIAQSAIAEHETRKAAEAAAAAEKAAHETRERQEKELRERLGLSPDANITEAMVAQAQRLAEFEAKELAATVTVHVNTAVKESAYPELIKQSFKAFIEGRKPKTKEEAEKVIAEAKGVFDPLAAAMRLKGMGMSDVQILGDVLENAAGVPSFAIASHEIAESMRKRGDWLPVNDERRKGYEGRGELMRRKYLERYDEMYQVQLKKESAQWQEAMLSTQLDLPYSVLRAIIDEAYPILIAAQAFDFDVVSQNPLKVFYEMQFVGESGFSVTAANEAFTSDHDVWVALAGFNIDLAGLTVTSDPAGTTYTLGTDYVIDYLAGRVKVLSTGTMANATGFLANYTYNAIRKGENQGIERARATVSSTTLEMVAERLATEITSETIKFSQSQLGFDAVARTINLLVKQVMKIVDGNLLNTATGLAASVANNFGGTWTSAIDSLDLLEQYIGVAKALVGNRNYTPTFVAMSLTNAERLSNSDHFTEAGSRPDSVLSADGMVGRIKGLPVFQSTQMSDSFILVANREIVQYRTMGDMQLLGPFHSIDSNRKLVAASQWYTEEYNGFISPIPSKAALVRVV